ncbi:(Glutamate--ammonia-ligase) adenylyltransferase [Magnetococcus marinus MC-1]|uniref:Bifunctional glutamine synthetase adenylyltransferase/adenylyl-removing enzyme n=1 Tax=Magnetococcus marinus (strain ATCC BAA-1437 / JCM 17883 / MC-1) TaxID=156889 RepID=A0L8S7_MAGMM|nr:bifunctional [glutamate--ammonia ligase]-adenylyl-L-tyrosine phosphorylase/[glutamate--ammonia-ligase] adenylyltransferase [Magnetococcus marinus]ABK44370.1 (Glutamate--ammonia-ligase) adenylyltransferase [Magnetococcus marinus MC-1]
MTTPITPLPHTLITHLALDAAAVDHIQRLRLSTAEPESVVHHLERCSLHLEGELLSHWQHVLADSRWRRRMILALGNSPFLSNILGRWPHFLAQLFHQPMDWTLDRYKAIILEDLLATTDQNVAEQRLRLHKHLAFLQIGLWDLTGEATLEETTKHLSYVGEATLEAAYQWLERHFASRFGSPMVVCDEGGTPQRARFVVLAMGKFGAYELNFSSDIDLIFLYDCDAGQTDGKQSITVKNYYVRLGRELMQMISRATAEGMVFRTDLRLRPDGESGELALSVRSAETYYESWGQSWERAAMIKARPVAGDLALGEAFLKNLHPFVYRRFLDFGALESIREMKKKIDHKVNNADTYGRNIKLGFGGIREIEFFVQSHQLIHGGREKRLQDRRTVPMLDTLATLGLVDRTTADFLASAYRFLRTVEHRIQIVREQQTHNLPDDDRGMAQLAARMGMPNRESFLAKLQGIRQRVHEAYDNLFFDAERTRQDELSNDARVEALLSTSTQYEQEKTRAILSQCGFHDLDQALLSLKLFKLGPQERALTEAGQRWFSRLAPLLLQGVLDAADVDMAMQHVEKFLQTILHRTNYLALLAENPNLLGLLMPLFGSSPFLSRHLIQHPSIMDSLVGLDFVTIYRGSNEMRQELARAMERAENEEERFNALRMFRNTEMLRLGIRDLAGIAELQEVMAALSAIATVVLEQAVMDAMSDMVERHGPPMWSDAQGQRQRARFMVLGMGKLGGGELNYSSDLDLIFIHTSQGDEQYTEGERSISNSQFFARMAQKVISTLTTLSQGGKLYEIDMRLRPSGASGPLVTTLESFAKYQQNEAWNWEHQALIRANVVVGERHSSEQLKQVIRHILIQPRQIAPLREDVVQMRERIYQEKRPKPGVVDIKQTRGGIVDVEFLIQFLVLAHAHQHPQLLQRNAPRALLAIRRAGLITPQAYQTLEDAYRFYRLVENRLRLHHDRSENAIHTEDSVTLARLARLCKLESGPALLEQLTHHFAAVQPIYATHLGPVAGEAPV